ncbi:hypothetical protein SCLARK_001420 [Spiroplasma clarkii]|uniref:hypothetical protein n=1 Tax=Spiroplasma clarkii TaxID=2139 RepID=UPI000B56F7E9|nr:hypothetical protein [Spiroplasma clarkii]ARU91945.1 hypothetical protein SCLARK_001420 [Spiroplasma clarkii]
MLEAAKIKQNLASNGYNWLPNYKNILTSVWAHIEVFFDEDETVQSALWASFKRDTEDYIGIVFITSKRCFTVECVENQTHVKYTPIQIYNLEKIQVQFSQSKTGLNYVSLVSDSFGNGTTFACPSQEVVNHFIDTLKGKTGSTIEFLPDSDDPLLAENEKEQLIDEDLNKATVVPPHKFQKKSKKLNQWRSLMVEEKKHQLLVKK